MTTTETRPESRADTNKPRICEVRLVILLKPWLRWPRFKIKCRKPATWVAINMCCGDTSLACDFHHDLEQSDLPRTLICGHCRRETTLEWSRLS